MRKSQFLASAAHAETEEAARAFILQVKRRYFDARHNAYAFILGERAEKQKSSDDGEPGGTAGIPILEALHRRGFSDSVLVVTRYFGGIKLGAGGLIRAYGHAANLALDTVKTVCMAQYLEVKITVPYACLAPLEHYLRVNHVHIVSAQYEINAILHVLISQKELETRTQDIANQTAGQGKVRKIKLCFAPCQAV